MATVTFKCGHCNNLMAVNAEYLGRQVRCPHCQQVVVAPAQQSAAAPPPPPPVPVLTLETAPPPAPSHTGNGDGLGLMFPAPPTESVASPYAATRAMQASNKPLAGQTKSAALSPEKKKTALPQFLGVTRLNQARSLLWKQPCGLQFARRLARQMPLTQLAPLVHWVLVAQVGRQ